MEITKIISAVNENEVYTEFVPLMSAAWVKLTGLKPIVGLISHKSEEDNFVRFARKNADVRLFSPIVGVDSGIQAKITRMCIAAEEEFREENCMIVDIDMITLSRDVVDVFKEVPSGHLVKWGYDHPSFSLGTADYGKWPMDRTTAPGKIFREIINPRQLQYRELIESWFGFCVYGREDVTLPFDKFSDESLLRALYEKWEKKETNTYNLPRTRLEEKMLCRRLDRSRPQDWDGLLRNLEDNKFIEVHGVRPFKKNIHYYKEILEFFEIKKKDV